ncbi:uncharacterized protein LOC100367529 [Saccoglossus kowalevskii]|uniref:Uncharacterized protein LOC100367529 n=1 Tax=Saccoglossus kowalevskii TaxID=10224 RepID=A0ABM0GSW5_SACKO|nr:PREDICTED: uncharacterized protein LOC100367529 [Saccoglossus kowalevskii]
MSSNINVREYGTWKSPITSASVTEDGVGLSPAEITVSDPSDQRQADIIYWSETRFERGSAVICSRRLGEDGFTTWTPENMNVYSRVHEYGGGAFFVYAGVLYFSNFTDNRMYAQKSPKDTPTPLTPADCGWRYADGQFSGKLNRIVCVREDHSGIETGQTKEAVNTIVMINPETKEQIILASGFDFYSNPRVSPDGSKICWIQWNHPNMPWNDTQLWTAHMKPDGSGIIDGSEKQIDIGNVSVRSPSWSPSSELYYICDKTKWWNLYRIQKNGEHEVLFEQQREIGGPAWKFGTCSYKLDPQGSGHCITTYGGDLELCDLNTKKILRKYNTGFTSHRNISYSYDGYIYCNAGSPTKFNCIIRVNVATGKTDIIRESRPINIDEGYLSIAQPISFPTADDKTAYAYFYPPNNKDFKAPEGSLPPLLVQIHGGPTSACSSDLGLHHQYFTSRGFAVLDVNFRGSTGYGTEYRNQLQENWGVYDVDDSCYGALYLAKTTKQVDINKLAISGGSAGGYTTLACLTFKDVFKAGVSHYGVADLEALAKETHKFESRYLDTMIGKYPEKKDVYIKRSPIHSVDSLSVPVAFFQGEDDKIVLPNQAEMMYNAVKAKGIPTSMVLFPGEYM